MKIENKICIDCKAEFIITSDEFSLYEKVGVVPTIQCFSCRVKQQFSFWMFGKFRKGVSDFSGGTFITMLPEKMMRAYNTY